MKIQSVWTDSQDQDAIQMILVQDGKERRIKLKRSANAALFEFIMANHPDMQEK